MLLSTTLNNEFMESYNDIAYKYITQNEIYDKLWRKKSYEERYIIVVT